jgi:transposase InsO family protein
MRRRCFSSDFTRFARLSLKIGAKHCASSTTYADVLTAFGKLDSAGRRAIVRLSRDADLYPGGRPHSEISDTGLRSRVFQRQKSAGDDVLTLAGTFDAFDRRGWRSRGRAGLVSRQHRRVLFRKTADSFRLGWSADGALRKSGVEEAASTQAKEDTNQYSSYRSSAFHSASFSLKCRQRRLPHCTSHFDVERAAFP